jgi:16S rRNA (cytosine1407-C5)-methyltransferase
MKKIIANQELHAYLKNLLPSEYQSYIETSAIPSAIRINTLKTNKDAFLAWSAGIGQPLGQLAFSSLGYLVTQDRLPLSHTLAFFLGHFQYQNVSSQVPVLLLDPRPGERVLDMAAAPGSKSTQIAACMHNQGTLVLNDWSHQRLQALNANLQRSGAINYYILNLRGESLGNLFPEYFDKVLLDAPCSALGTLASNREIHFWWKYERMQKLTHIQYQLLVAAIKALKPGGECVYSTCSIAPEENELLIERICNSYPVEVLPLPAIFKNRFASGWNTYQGISLKHDQEKAIRIWPQRHGFEGFYAVKLRKTAAVLVKKRREGSFTPTITMADPLVYEIISHISREWGIPLSHFSSYRYKLTKNRIWMVGSDVDRYLDQRFVSAGLLLAERRLQGWKLPSNSSQVFGKQINKNIITLDEKQIKQLFAHSALAYTGLPIGYDVVRYRGDTIGTVYSDTRQIKIRLPHAFDLKL